MTLPATEIVYPENDGKPMSDNTLQFEWIQRLTANLAALFRGRADVFVGGDLLWYPVEGFPEIRQAPDTFVVLGRPQHYRGSYQQWKEDNVPMTVVFEVLSPANTNTEMRAKLEFYQEYGAEEYYVIDPDSNTLEIYRRRGDAFAPQRLRGERYTSPLLGIHFDLSESELIVRYPDDRPFVHLADERHRADTAEERAGAAEERAGAAEERLARVIELARKVRQGVATAEDLADLERLANG